MRSVWLPLSMLAAVIVAFIALNPINGTHTDCQGQTCVVTMDGIESKVNVLGVDLKFFGADGQTAFFGAGGKTYGCQRGKKVETPQLDLVCTDIGSDIVRMDVKRSAR